MRRHFVPVAISRSFYYRKQEASEAELFGYARDFFEQEYRLDHHIHSYRKPLICVADGICMGGGIGLFAGADFRVVTERSLFAMPEVTIGLYPDVGASWFLSRMPGRLGALVWSDWCPLQWRRCPWGRVGGSRYRQWRAKVRCCHASPCSTGLSVGDPREQIDLLLRGLHGEVAARLPAPVLLPHQQKIDALLAGRTLQGVLARLFSADFDEQEAVLKQAQEICRTGSPISRAILWRQYWQARRQSLAEVFADELTLSVNCVLKGDFVEGVRALLIDKDKDPRWQQLPSGRGVAG